MYDATEIFRTLSGHKTESFFKLGFYLLSFFYYLYRCVLLLQLIFHRWLILSLDQDDRRSHIRERVDVHRPEEEGSTRRVETYRRTHEPTPSKNIIYLQCDPRYIPLPCFNHPPVVLHAFNVGVYL